MGSKKMLLIGRTGSGKTTLIQRMENLTLEYAKTQSMQVYVNFLDSPGEYLENRGYYRALIVSSADVDVIGIVQDCTLDDVWFPPMFASVFSKEVVGIVTKVDMADNQGAIDKAEEKLINAGAEKIFRVSAKENIGIENLTSYIHS